MTVHKPGDNENRPVDKRLAERGTSRDALKNRDFQLPPLRVCPFSLDEVLSELERERHGRPVREYRPAFSRDYLDLLALADAEIRHNDEQKRDSA